MVAFLYLMRDNERIVQQSTKFDSRTFGLHKGYRNMQVSQIGLGRPILRGLVVILLSSLLVGCGDAPPLGQVSGVVRWQGEPLPQATVTFNPPDGRLSYGQTDAQGRYTLRFADGREGAELGDHHVSIETYQITLDPDGNEVIVPERLPKKFNLESELRFTVESGLQSADFSLSD